MKWGIRHRRICEGYMSELSQGRTVKNKARYNKGRGIKAWQMPVL
ncbi:MAG TPA: hypothetical protein VD731_06850 [Nitrosopumilaceae archaeon]|nr:hypothetical protein [Nitrosopumilaceae archaeon]